MQLKSLNIFLSTYVLLEFELELKLYIFSNVQKQKRPSELWSGIHTIFCFEKAKQTRSFDFRKKLCAILVMIWTRNISLQFNIFGEDFEIEHTIIGIFIFGSLFSKSERNQMEPIRFKTIVNNLSCVLYLNILIELDSENRDKNILKGTHIGKLL